MNAVPVFHTHVRVVPDYEPSSMNPIPGEPYHNPSRHGHKLAFYAYHFLSAIESGDKAAATTAGAELAQQVYDSGGSKDFASALAVVSAKVRDRTPNVPVATVASELLGWSTAVSAGDQPSAARYGNEFLTLLAQVGGVGPDVLQGLFDTMQRCVHAARPVSVHSGGGNGPGADDGGSADAIDWHEPGSGTFYVLDQKSGVELSLVLEHLRRADDLVAWGCRPPNRLLFVGPPGCGKTVGAHWLGDQLNKSVAVIRLDGVKGSADGKTSKNLRACVEAAAEAGAIIVIDEMEGVAVKRADSSPNTPEWFKQVTQSLLQLFDWLLKEYPDVIFVGCTNVPQAIDEAVLRRLRTHVIFYPPDRPARAAMLKQWWSKAPHAGAAKRRLLDFTEGLSGDYVQRIAETAMLVAIPRGRGNGNEVTVADVDAAVRKVLVLGDGPLPDVVQANADVEE